LVKSGRRGEQNEKTVGEIEREGKESKSLEGRKVGGKRREEKNEKITKG